MPLLVVQVIMSFFAIGLMLFFHVSWLPPLFESLNQTPDWFLMTTELKPLSWGAYLSFALVLLLNLVFLKDLLIQFMQKHWDLTAIMRGFAITLTGIFVVLGLLVFNAPSHAQDAFYQAQLEKVKAIKQGMTPVQVRYLMADLLLPESNSHLMVFKGTGFRLNLHLDSEKLKGFTFKRYKPQCFILWEMPLKKSVEYPLVCSETLN